MGLRLTSSGFKKARQAASAIGLQIERVEEEILVAAWKSTSHCDFTVAVGGLNIVILPGDLERA